MSADHVLSKSTPASEAESWFTDGQVLAEEFRAHLGRTCGLDRLEGFEVHEFLSRGGQATVFAGVDRTTGDAVAVKVLAEGAFSSDTSRRRFEREVEVVAELRHPNIVTALTFGTGDAGPFLVMPRVDGTPLDQWAAPIRGSGDVRRIVETIVKVCETVHFAHQHGVIHRDLKPSNVLIAAGDEPNVLDFGLAKLFANSLTQSTSRTTMTGEGQFVGSLPWTSPEQLAGDNQQIDVRTDVYAIGVMLYQSLTGAFPYRVDGALPAVVYGVMNVAPSRPSTINEAVTTDLDAIVLKALSKTPDGRYSTADEFARDLRSFLSGEPIVARRERARQALQRHVRRYRAITLVTVALLAVVALLYSRAASERDRAEFEAAKARTSAEFLQDLLAEIDPRRSGTDVTVSELLDQAALLIQERLGDQPEVAATLELTLGKAYANLAFQDLADRHLQSAWDLRRGLLGENHPDTLEAEFYLAGSAERSYAEQAALFRHVAEQRALQLGPASREALEAEIYLITTQLNVAGDVAGASAKLDDLIARASASLSPTDRLLHKIEMTSTRLLLRYGDLAEAVRACRAMFTEYSSHPDREYEFRLGAETLLGLALLRMERFDEAELLIEDAFAATYRVLGPSHPAVMRQRILRARLFGATGRLREADGELTSIAEYQDDLSRQIGLYDAGYQVALVGLRSRQGRADEAINWLQAWIERRAAMFGPDHLEVRNDECLMMSLLVEAGRCDAAIELAGPLLEYFADRPISNDRLAKLELEFGECLLKMGRVEAACAVLPYADEVLSRLFSEEHSLVVRVRRALR